MPKVARKHGRGKATAVIISGRRLCRDLLRAYLTTTVGLSVIAEAQDIVSLEKLDLCSGASVTIWCGASAKATDGSARIPLLDPGAPPLVMVLCDDTPRWPPLTRWAGKVTLVYCREGLRGLAAGLNRVLERESRDARGLTSPHAPTSDLTKRQHEVVDRVARGWTNERIAKSLGLSPRTVERHRSNAMKRLGVRSTGQLVGEAARRSLIELGAALAEDETEG